MKEAKKIKPEDVAKYLDLEIEYDNALLLEEMLKKNYEIIMSDYFENNNINIKK